MTSRKKILVADASETIISVCRKLLTQHGYDATLLQDGTKALEELKRGAYDLAVIATATDNCSGYFILQELKKDPTTAKLQVLLLLGSSELTDTKELVELSPDDTLTKPFSPQELLYKIDQLLKRAQASEPQDEEVDIESILTDDEQSFEKKISSATDKIFLSMLKQSTTDEPEKEPSGPTLDKLDLSEDQYDLESHQPEPRSEESESPHDYDWFINEMRQDSAEPGATPEPTPSSATPAGEDLTIAGVTGKFQIEEIGTSKITTGQLNKMRQTDADTKSKIYIEKLQEDLDNQAAMPAGAKSGGGAQSTDIKTEFVRSFAESLAKEIARNIDFDKLVQKLEEAATEKTPE